MLYKNSSGRVEHLSVVDLENAKREISTFQVMDASEITSVYGTSWIGIHGTKYIPDECILLIRSSENDTPVFGTLRIIWVVNLEVIVFLSVHASNSGF